MLSKKFCFPIGMRRHLNLLMLLSFFLIFVFGVTSTSAEENLAQQAYQIFQVHCMTCHGAQGTFKETLRIDRELLIESRTVVPGDPLGSEFYRRLTENTVVKPQMPLGTPPLSDAAIDTVRRWILSGAPDWEVSRDVNFITPEAMLKQLSAHLSTLPAFDRPFARYFTMTHLYNAGESPETLHLYRTALSKLVNSLSWGSEVINPQPIDALGTLFYIDLRKYEWDIRDAWGQIETVYPYTIEYTAESDPVLFLYLTSLREGTDSNVPFVHVDWFLATAALPPLYHDILDLPATDRLLETDLDVNVERNLQTAPGVRVYRAGFNDSGVSNHNRVVERHASRYGAYWKSYDFAGSAGKQNVYTHPLSFQPDGGEIVFHLPNGLQAYLIVDADGQRIDVAPTSIVSNPQASDPAVHNGLSCIGCHTEGMKPFTDTVRAAILSEKNPAFDKDQALRLYVEKTVMDPWVEKDTQQFRDALEATGAVFGGLVEPVAFAHEAFIGPVSASHAAAAVGLETETFLTEIREKSSLQSLGLLALAPEGGNVKRDAWTSNFQQVISALNSPDSDLPPVVQRPERIPGAGVYIPDPNLRAAIAEALGKENTAFVSFTADEMATLTEIDAEGKGIKDLRGIELATNLLHFNVRSSLISDLSPLAGLTKLRVLNFVDNLVSDLSPIAGLINLTSLDMPANLISDLSPIASLTKLEWLAINENANISDYSPLAELINLREFYSWGNPISDLSPLAGLTKLSKIDICGSEVSDLSPLTGLTGLKELYLVENNISDLSALAGLTGLTRLNLEQNNISDVSPLAGLTHLKWLKLTDNPIIDFSPLEVLAETTNILTGEVAIRDPNLRAAIAEALGKENTAFVSMTAEEMATLTELHAADKGIRDITGIAFAKNLIELSIHDNPLSDISPLASLTKLRRIWLHDTEVADLSPLASLRDLEVINVAHTRISNLTPLAGLKNLKKLDTIHSDITDLSPLEGLTNLTRLLLYDCKATDLSPLRGLTKLRWLGFPHTNNITDFSPLSGLTELRHLDLFNTEISDLSALSGLVNLETLILVENRIVDVSPLASLHNLKRLEIHVNNILDFSPLDPIRETIEVFSWYSNPGFPQGGPKITGPWLWLTLPVRAEEDGEVLLTDYLAEASNNKVTEEQIATLGASEGTVIRENVWSVGTLEPYNANDRRNNVHNLKRLLDTQGAIEFFSEGGNSVVYGSITLYSPRTQHTKIFIGASEPRKIYLNGELVHEDYADYVIRSWAWDYQTFFPITLQPGKNVLLIKLGGEWDNDLLSFFFGLEPGTEYQVSNPRVGYTLSESTVHAGDTFTLDLSAENVFDLAGWQFDIAFDPAVLEVVEVNEGDFLKENGGATFFQKGTIDNTTGKITKISSTRFNEDGATGTGTLLSVTFTAKTGGETQVALENFQLGSITGEAINAGPHEVTFTIEGQLATGDVNRDGQVSVLDLILVSRHLGEDASTNPQADVNNDGVINIQDLIFVAQHLGESTAAAAPFAIAINNGELTPARVQAWITQAEVEDDGSITFREGIANLEQLLTLFIPEETALLHNYPNPFNPETWIPYQLSKPADVSLTIYAANGQVVRTLALGHQAAGMYQSHSRAAYWDGRNAEGEPVASGLYFYTLTAGDFTATRKLVIRK